MTTVTDQIEAVRLRREVAALREQLAEVRDDFQTKLAALRRSLAAEVVTRKLTVLDANGRPVVYTEMLEDAVQLRVEHHYGSGDDDVVGFQVTAGHESVDPNCDLSFSVGERGWEVASSLWEPTCWR